MVACVVAERKVRHCGYASGGLATLNVPHTSYEHLDAPIGRRRGCRNSGCEAHNLVL